MRRRTVRRPWRGPGRAAAGRHAEQQPRPHWSQLRTRRQRQAARRPVVVLLSTDAKAEPRIQVNDRPKTQQIFGIDVEGLAPEQEAVIARPWLSAREPGQVPPGRYWVQAVLHKYETFTGPTACRQAADGSR